MIRRSFAFGLVLVCIALLLTGSLFAQGQDADKGKSMPSDADMQKMMADMVKYSAPGPEHAQLKRLEGHWTTGTKWWMDPKGTPMETKGSADFKMILGGRYLQLESQDEVMGKPTHGIGTIGFDLFRKEYFMSWIDDMGTAMFTARGTADGDGKVITFNGLMDEPMTGEKDKKVKYVMRRIDDNNNVFEGWDLVGTPSEFKAFEVTYSRK